MANYIPSDEKLIALGFPCIDRDDPKMPDAQVVAWNVPPDTEDPQMVATRWLRFYIGGGGGFCPQTRSSSTYKQPQSDEELEAFLASYTWPS